MKTALKILTEGKSLSVDEAGLPIAKHGSRAISSRSGAGDVERIAFMANML